MEESLVGLCNIIRAGLSAEDESLGSVALTIAESFAGAMVRFFLRRLFFFSDKDESCGINLFVVSVLLFKESFGGTGCFGCCSGIKRVVSFDFISAGFFPGIAEESLWKFNESATRIFAESLLSWRC